MDLEKSAQIWRDLLKRSDLTPEDRVALHGTIDEIIPVLSRLEIETDPFRLIEGREAAMVLEEASEIGKTKPEEEKEQEAAKKTKARKSHQTPHIGIKSILQTPIEEEGVEAQTPKTRFEQLQQAGKTINKGDEAWGWKEVVPSEYEKGIQKTPQTEIAPTPARAAPVQAAPRGAGVVGGINRAARGVGRRRIRFSRRRRRGVGGAASTAQTIVKDAKKLRLIFGLISAMISAIPLILIFVFIVILAAAFTDPVGFGFNGLSAILTGGGTGPNPVPRTCADLGGTCRTSCQSGEQETEGTCTTGKCCATRPPETQGFKYYCQYGKVDENYNVVVNAYWNYNDGKCDIYHSGCGPATIAMALSSQGYDVKPDEASQQNKAYDGNWNIGCNAHGTSTRDIEYVVKPWAENRGFKMTYNLARNTCASCWGTLNLQELKNFIDNGNYIIAFAGVKVDSLSGLTSSYIGHIFLIVDVNPSEGSVTAYDPTFCRNYKGIRTLKNVNEHNVSVGCYDYTDSDGNTQTRCGWRAAYAIRKQ